MAYDRFNGMDAFAGYLISVLKCNNLFTPGSNTLLHPLLSGWDTNKRLELARPERINYMLCELFKDMDSVKQYFTESSELFDLANNDFKNALKNDDDFWKNILHTSFTPAAIPNVDLTTIQMEEEKKKREAAAADTRIKKALEKIKLEDEAFEKMEYKFIENTINNNSDDDRSISTAKKQRLQ